MFYNNRIFNRCFNYRGKQIWRNFKEIPRYFYLMHFLVKHGYDEYATWETFNWFTYTMKEILTHYKEKNSGAPFILDAPELDPYSDEYTELNQQEWNNALYGDDATLKRFYKDTKNRRFRLHPENDELDDTYVDEVIIQGVAVGVYHKFEQRMKRHV